jgi:hypothetical protein
MTQFRDIDALTSALRDLGDTLAARGHMYELYVIGGAAFLLQEPRLARATGDLDVAAMLLEDGEIVAPVPLPTPLAEAAAAVASLHDLSPGWINSAAAASFDNLLPDGALDRARVQRWGTLTLRIADRIDLVKLKFQAAQRRGAKGARYRDDLARMQPTDGELTDALAWYLSSQTDAATAGDRARQVLEEVEAMRNG